MAQVYNSSISSATGGTGRAAVEAGDASFLNPATLVHLRGRHLFSSVTQDEYAVTLSDNTQESVIPTAFGFVKHTRDLLSKGELQEQDLSLSLADFIVDKWTIGITGHYLEQRLGEARYMQTNGDLGVVFTPNAKIGAGLVVYNIFGERVDIPEELRKKRSAGAGFNYIYKKYVRIRLDATTESEYMAGLETYINAFIISRLGYSINAPEQRNLFTAGMGFKGPRFAINYAYEGNPESSSDYRHSVDLGIPFW